MRESRSWFGVFLGGFYCASVLTDIGKTLELPSLKCAAALFTRMASISFLFCVFLAGFYSAFFLTEIGKSLALF